MSPRPAPGSAADPWRLEGTALAPEILLVAKLLAASVLLQGYVAAIPEPFLPLVPGLRLPWPELVRGALQVVAVVAAVAVLGNRRTRAAAFALGAVLLFSLLANRAGYRNSIVFVSVVLLLVGLSEGDRARVWLRVQLGLVYGGSALNKALDPDWRSGRYMVHWLGEVVESPLWTAVSSAVDPSLAGIATAWTTIGLEAVLAIGFMVPALTPFAVGVAVAFHATTVVVAGTTFGIFVSALVFTYPAFFPWPPPGEAVARYDPSRRSHRLLRWYAERADRDGRVEPRPSTGHMTLMVGSRRLRGVVAAGVWAALLPATWFAAVVVAAAPAWLHWGAT